uniref:Uncharacterized protein n=1 Tax=Knipowitschia caucasica TaxID=637954 RepID=A0AAV2J5M0_KNICA
MDDIRGEREGRCETSGTRSGSGLRVWTPGLDSGRDPPTQISPSFRSGPDVVPATSAQASPRSECALSRRSPDAAPSLGVFPPPPPQVPWLPPSTTPSRARTRAHVVASTRPQRHREAHLTYPPSVLPRYLHPRKPHHISAQNGTPGPQGGIRWDPTPVLAPYNAPTPPWNPRNRPPLPTPTTLSYPPSDPPFTSAEPHTACPPFLPPRVTPPCTPPPTPAPTSQTSVHHVWTSTDLSPPAPLVPAAPPSPPPPPPSPSPPPPPPHSAPLTPGPPTPPPTTPPRSPTSPTPQHPPTPCAVCFVPPPSPLRVALLLPFPPTPPRSPAGPPGYPPHTLLGAGPNDTTPPPRAYRLVSLFATPSLYFCLVLFVLLLLLSSSARLFARRSLLLSLSLSSLVLFLAFFLSACGLSFCFRASAVYLGYFAFCSARGHPPAPPFIPYPPRVPPSLVLSLVPPSSLSSSATHSSIALALPPSAPPLCLSSPRSCIRLASHAHAPGCALALSPPALVARSLSLPRLFSRRPLALARARSLPLSPISLSTPLDSAPRSPPSRNSARRCSARPPSLSALSLASIRAPPPAPAP